MLKTLKIIFYSLLTITSIFIFCNLYSLTKQQNRLYDATITYKEVVGDSSVMMVYDIPELNKVDTQYSYKIADVLRNNVNSVVKIQQYYTTPERTLSLFIAAILVGLVLIIDYIIRKIENRNEKGKDK